ncbi:MAG: long-chain fatty acid--CoA ligase [Bacteroidetes bacterium]|nr:long-chain fatty acid--CoA ligase [Bacteroidota bacterium]
MDFTRLFEVLEYQQHRYPQQMSIAGRQAHQWRNWSTAALLSERDRLSAGLLHCGLREGERVGILAHCGSPQWIMADAALLQIGLVPVPIHATARMDEIQHIAKDAELKACFVSNDAMLQKLIVAEVHFPSLFFFENLPEKELIPENTRCIPWDELACDPDEHLEGRIRFLRDGIQPERLATILYTSGTTGLPKGVMLSHANIVSNIKSVLAIVPVGPGVPVISFLPLSHIFERMVTYAYQAAGAPLWFAEAVEHLPKILPDIRPHFMTAVPRVLERMYERLQEERTRSGVLRRKVLDWALGLAERYPYSGGGVLPPAYAFKRWLADMLVFRHWRKRMGGRIRYIAVGAAALQPRLGRLFSAAGIEVREGYGLTETSPVVAFNRFEPGGVHFGTVGIPAPGVEVRIGGPLDEDGNGEIEVRGPNVTSGYLHLPEETAARFTEDGWFKTGDLGRFEHKRFLKVTGRRSEVFKTTSGKFVAPAFVEQQLLRSPFISQCMVVGANQPFAAALIVPEFGVLENWCRENKVHWTAPQFMVLNPKVEKLFRQEIEHINETRLGTIEKIRHFHLLFEPWTAENGLLTPTLKLRRERLAEQHKGAIGKMFSN